MSIIILTSAIDVKSFRALMTKHSLTIAKELKTKAGFSFEVECASDDLESIMVETNLSWEFA